MEGEVHKGKKTIILKYTGNRDAFEDRMKACNWVEINPLPDMERLPPSGHDHDVYDECPHCGGAL